MTIFQITLYFFWHWAIGVPYQLVILTISKNCLQNIIVQLGTRDTYPLMCVHPYICLHVKHSFPFKCLQQISAHSPLSNQSIINCSINNSTPWNYLRKKMKKQQKHMIRLCMVPSLANNDNQNEMSQNKKAKPAESAVANGAPLQLFPAKQ